MEISQTKQDIESRFQLVITLAIFFPTLVATFLAGSETMTEKQANNTGLGWTASIGIFLLSYLFFAIVKNKLSYLVLRLLSWSLIASIAVFIFPTIVTTTAQIEKTPSWFNYIFLVASFRGLVIAPFVVFGLLFIGIVIYFLKTETKLRLPKWLV